MESITQKAYFLRNNFVNKIREIAPNTVPAWGKMNLQQMTEHMSYALRQASGKDTYHIMTPEENLPRMQQFLMSDKPFRENTPNQLLPDEPAAPAQPSMEASLLELQNEIEYFFEVFNKEPDKEITNPFFGHLNYEMQVQLLHKHAWHHLRQFGVQH